MSDTRKERIRRLLKVGIETGDPEAVAVVDEAKYIQHNPQTHEGSEGLATLFARLAKTSPRVNIVRIFSDGDFVFGHTEYDFSTRRIGFEVFRFEGDSAVEHWDNIQPRRGPNPAGRSMVDGGTEAADLHATDANRERIHAFVDSVLIGRDLARLSEFMAPGLVQHNPELADGADALRAYLAGADHGRTLVEYERVHRVLAEGDFVLAVCEGRLAGVHTSFYDLYRLEDGRIAEHWDTIEHVPPPSDWKNDNGKF